MVENVVKQSKRSPLTTSPWGSYSPPIDESMGQSFFSAWRVLLVGLCCGVSFVIEELREWLRVASKDDRNEMATAFAAHPKRRSKKGKANLRFSFARFLG